MPQVASNSARRSEILARRLASIKTAALYAEVCERTIRRRIADGTLTGYRFGRVIRVDLDELDAALRPIPSGGAA